MITLRCRTLVAFFAGVAVALVAGFALQTWRVDAAPGDADTTFVPITACRLIDTRPAPDRIGSHGSFSADDTKTIQAHDNQGNCTIPIDAVALSLNVTAVDASAPTFLTFWPAGDLPLAASLNPWPGQPPTPNAVTVDLSVAGSFKVYNLAGSVDVIIDITGYYTGKSLQDLTYWTSLNYLAIPVTASDFAESVVFHNEPTELVSATLTPPLDGKATVWASAQIRSAVGASGTAECSITTGTTVEARSRTISWNLPPAGPISGIRVFDVNEGETSTYRLICTGPFDSVASNINIASTFTVTE